MLREKVSTADEGNIDRFKSFRSISNIKNLLSFSSDQFMSHMNQLQHLKIPLVTIKHGTEEFAESNLIGEGGYGRVYKGILPGKKGVAVKRLNSTGFQGKKEFYTEVLMLSQYQHANIITLVGFCDDSNEMILVYEYAARGSLDMYLRNHAMLGQLSWEIRLKICIGVASALNYLHNHVAEQHRVIHRDLKSANILLDEDWNAKLSDFGLAKIGLSNQQNTFLITNVAGTYGYCDPQYEKTGILTKESDIYSFGVVLFEVLCGRLACVMGYHDNRRFLHHLARTHYTSGELDKIVDFRIMKNIKSETLKSFSVIAYQCLQETREERPTITEVEFQLKKVMESHWDVDMKLEPAASIIQRCFRSYLFRSKNRALSELSVAKAKIKELETWLKSDMYRTRLAHDYHEMKRYTNGIVLLINTIDAIKGSHVLVTTSKRSMLDKLQGMLDEVNRAVEKGPLGLTKTLLNFSF